MAQANYCPDCGAYKCDGPSCNRGLAGGRDRDAAFENLEAAHEVGNVTKAMYTQGNTDIRYFCSRECREEYEREEV